MLWLTGISCRIPLCRLNSIHLSEGKFLTDHWPIPCEKSCIETSVHTTIIAISLLRNVIFAVAKESPLIQLQLASMPFRTEPILSSAFYVVGFTKSPATLSSAMTTFLFGRTTRNQCFECVALQGSRIRTCMNGDSSSCKSLATRRVWPFSKISQDKVFTLTFLPSLADWINFKVPITPKNVFYLVQSLYGIRKNAAKIFAFG